MLEMGWLAQKVIFSKAAPQAQFFKDKHTSITLTLVSEAIITTLQLLRISIFYSRFWFLLASVFFVRTKVLYV